MDAGGQVSGSSKDKFNLGSGGAQFGSPPSKNPGTSTSSQIVPGVDPPSPLRFVADTANYTFTLRSSGLTAPSALDGLRQLIMATLGGIVRVEQEYMFEDSLPIVDDIDNIVSKVMAKCIELGYIVGNRWQGFPEDPAVRHKKRGKVNSENKIFEGFGDLWNNIVKISQEFFPKLPDGQPPEPTVKFHSVPDTHGIGERDSEAIKPDAILELVKSSMIDSYATRERNARGYCICDAACPVEVKPEANDANRVNNIWKLTHNANRYFVDDLRRRAVYGLEIENTDFRVLTYTRTGAIVCEPFNWIEDHRSLIRVIICLSFASEEELGYDPHIRRIPVELDLPNDSKQPDDSGTSKNYTPVEEPKQVEESEPSKGATPKKEPKEVEQQPLRRSKRSIASLASRQKAEEEEANKKRKIDIDDEIAYEIDVGNRTFITFGKCISDVKADFFVGRATRIYHAYEKGDTERKLFILKVSHVSTSAADGGRVEGQILAEINAKARELNCETYFPTLVCQGFPQIHRARLGVKSDSSNLFLRKKVVGLGFYPGVVAIRTTQGSSRTAGSNRLCSRGEIFSPIVPSPTGLPSSVQTNVGDFLRTSFPRRYQHRIVTREVGSTINNLKEMNKIFYALEQTTHALKWLHFMGYLHRDLSLGNILIVDVEETPENMGMRVILNDYDSSKRSDVMTSAKSVRTGTPEFLSNELLQERYLFTLRQAQLIQSFPSRLKQAELERTPPPNIIKSKVRVKPHPNFLHDAESLIWIVFWFLWHTVPLGYNSEAPQEQKHEQWVTGNVLYSQPQGSLTVSSRLACFTQDDVFQSNFETLPTTYHPLYPPLDKIRLCILNEFVDWETSPSFNGPISFKGAKGKPVFYETISDCFKECQNLVQEWKSPFIDQFIPRHEDIISLQTAVEDVDVEYDPNRVMQGSVDSDGSSTNDSKHYDVFGPLPRPPLATAAEQRL